MKLGTLLPTDTTKLAAFDADDVSILWVHDFYDGPISGMAEVAGVRYLFEIVDCNVLGTEEDHRAYWLIKLKPEQLASEEEWHELFCQNVGTHFDNTGRLPLPDDQVNMDAFYTPFRSRTPPDYRDNEVMGWFRLG